MLRGLWRGFTVLQQTDLFSRYELEWTLRDPRVVQLTTGLDMCFLSDLTIELDCCSLFSSSFVDWWTWLLHPSVSDALNSVAEQGWTMRTVFAWIGNHKSSVVEHQQCIARQHRWGAYSVQGTVCSVHCTIVQCTLHNRWGAYSAQVSTAQCTVHRWGANYRANRKHPSWMETAAARTCQSFPLL